jgi:hypothetical protein
MRVLCLIISFISLSIVSNAQSFNEDKTAFANFIKRMHTAAPFDGVKIVEDYDKKYLISVVSLDKSKYTNASTLNRVAQVKSQAQVNRFVNGSSVSSDIVIKTTERKQKDSTEVLVETIESIKEQASGFTQGMELLINFDSANNKEAVFVFSREIKQ